MCGRYQVAWAFGDLQFMFALARAIVESDIIPRYNVCPTYIVPVVRFEDGARVPEAMRWGFPATWLKRQGKNPWSRSLINAKAAEAHKKPTWRKALRERRCIVPASGFYEWKTVGKKRYPLLFERVDGKPMAMAGVWGEFEKDGERVRRFSVLTAGPGPEVAPYHNRGPVILEEADWDAWLDPAMTDPDEIQGFFRDIPAGLLRAREVNTALGSIKNTGPQLMEADWRLADLAADNP